MILYLLNWWYLSFLSPPNNQIMLQEYAICLPCWNLVLEGIATFLSGGRDNTEEILFLSLVDVRCWEHVHEQMYSIWISDAFLKVASWFQILWPYLFRSVDSSVHYLKICQVYFLLELLLWQLVPVDFNLFHAEEIRLRLSLCSRRDHTPLVSYPVISLISHHWILLCT